MRPCSRLFVDVSKHRNPDVRHLGPQNLLRRSVALSCVRHTSTQDDTALNIKQREPFRRAKSLSVPHFVTDFAWIQPGSWLTDYLKSPGEIQFEQCAAAESPPSSGGWTPCPDVPRYGITLTVAIVSFDDRSAENFHISGKVAKGTGWSNAANIVKRKLDMIRYAVQLSDLKSPPGNQLEALAGNLKGWHSIRVNDQWRIIFVWQKDGAGSVKVVDYH